MAVRTTNMNNSVSPKIAINQLGESCSPDRISCEKRSSKSNICHDSTKFLSLSPPQRGKNNFSDTRCQQFDGYKQQQTAIGRKQLSIEVTLSTWIMTRFTLLLGSKVATPKGECARDWNCTNSYVVVLDGWKIIQYRFFMLFVQSKSSLRRFFPFVSLVFLWCCHKFSIYRQYRFFDVAARHQ